MSPDSETEAPTSMRPEDGAPVSYPPTLSSWRLLCIWLAVGLQSFGGGGTTLVLIRRAAVEQYGWLTAAEFTRQWGLCQMAPGINLLALVILIGRRVAGVRGIVLGLVGLLLPSVAITILMAACFARMQRLEAVRAALRGVIPATVGIGLLVSLQMMHPLLEASYREGRASLLLSVVLLAGSGTAVAAGHLPVFLVVCTAGGVCAIANWARQRVQLRREEE